MASCHNRTDNDQICTMSGEIFKLSSAAKNDMTKPSLRRDVLHSKYFAICNYDSFGDCILLLLGQQYDECQSVQRVKRFSLLLLKSKNYAEMR